MKKFMIFISPQGKSIFDLPEETQQNHIQKVGAYIGQLKERGLLLDAQPLEPTGTIITGDKATLSTETLTKPNLAGFYALQAENLESIMAVLKEDPRFEDARWKLEIREVLDVM